MFANISKKVIKHIRNHMTISYDIIICNDFNGSMTSWRLKMDNLFDTIPKFFTIFTIFKKIITVVLFFAQF